MSGNPWEAWFHEAGFTDLWYAHPGPRPYASYQPLGDDADRFGPRWHAGLWRFDLVVVRGDVVDEADAERWLSPGGWTPEDAVRRAVWKWSPAKAQQWGIHAEG